MMALIEAELAEELQSQAPLPAAGSGRVSRRVRHFPIPPAVDIRPTSAAPTIRSTSSPATGPACSTASRASSPNTS
jgi:UTP:GlnB (protein PII) uridylyltransferase